MTPRLQKLLDRLRKPKCDTQDTATEEREDSVEESPSLILVPDFVPKEDEFSRYF